MIMSFLHTMFKCNIVVWNLTLQGKLNDTPWARVWGFNEPRKIMHALDLPGENMELKCLFAAVPTTLFNIDSNLSQVYK